MAVIDANLVLSSSISDYIRVDSNAQKLKSMTLSNFITVLPAFELRAHADPALISRLRNMDKSILTAFYRNRTVTAIRYPQRTQSPTKYGHWLTSDDFYYTSYKYPYEPWYIAHKALMPLYDERFLG